MRIAWISAGFVASTFVLALALRAEEVQQRQAVQQETPKKWNVEELRKQYPLVSLARRLEYETKRTAKVEPNVRPSSIEQMEKFERSARHRAYGLRSASLAMLHSERVAEFVSADGFGRSRLPSPSPGFLPLPKVEPLPLAKRQSESAGEASAAVQLPAKDVPLAKNEFRLPSIGGLADFHWGAQFNFAAGPGVGFAQDRDHVAGFESHRFSHPLEFPTRSGKGQEAGDAWRICQLELVSLLKYDVQVVYVSDHLPRMDELEDAKTRSLSTFERKSLARLRDGEDLSVDATVNRISMVGALRAARQCTECHQVKRGELLGAFSYELERQPPLVVKPVAKPES